MRANERMDERVAQYFSLYSWLLSTIVLPTFPLTSQTHVEGLSESDVATVRQGRDNQAIHAAQELVLVDKIDIGDTDHALKREDQ